MENGRQRAGYKERMRDMALRQIRTLGDEVLTKKCREVKEMTPRLRTLAADMLETMYHAEGVGLAAPQVGVLRRIVVINVGEGPVTLVNPVVVEEHVIVKALDLDMKEITVEGRDLFARALCHEIDHLDGVMYISKVEGELYSTQPQEEDEEDEEEDV